MNSCTLNMCIIPKTKKTNNVHNFLSHVEPITDDGDQCIYVDELSEIDTTDDLLTLIQLNIHGLLSKQDHLIDILTKRGEIDLCLVNETWLTEYNKKQLHIRNFNYEGVNRKDKKGGGVGIISHNTLKYKRRYDLEYCNKESFESCWIELTGVKHKIVVGSVYRPPNTSETEFIQSYTEIVKKVTIQENKECIIGPDHNLDLLKSHLHTNTHKFVESTLKLNMIPVITKPT